MTLRVDLSLGIHYVNSCPRTNCPDFLLILESGTDVWEDAFHFSPIARELQKVTGSTLGNIVSC